MTLCGDYEGTREIQVRLIHFNFYGQLNTRVAKSSLYEDLTCYGVS